MPGLTDATPVDGATIDRQVAHRLLTKAMGTGDSGPNCSARKVRYRSTGQPRMV
jgi:hypothetical protein